MPVEIKEFMEHRDISKVSIPSDPGEYGHRWTVWWRSIQPPWRLSGKEEMPMKNDAFLPPKPNWKRLSISGENGIVLAIVGLAIWSISVKKCTRNRSAGIDVNLALKDVSLVLRMMSVSWRAHESPVSKKMRRS